MGKISPETDILITDWFRRVRESQRIHYECGTYFSRFHYRLGVPAIILSAAVGTAVFASLENAAPNSTRIVVGLVSILAAILTSLQTFLGFAERADRHRVTGSEYGAVRRSLELLKTFPPDDEETLKQAINLVKTDMDTLAKSAPEVPSRLKSRVDEELKSPEHRRVFHLYGKRSEAGPD